MEFIESICVENGEIKLLQYHQNRVNKTFETFFYNKTPFRLDEVLSKLEITQAGKVKIRIEYDKSINKIEYADYVAQSHPKFFLCEVTKFDYSFKFKKRDFFNQFRGIQPIFVQNNSITDCSYANLIFYKKGKWYTPDTYLLNGVKRQYLLYQSHIQEARITLENIFEFEKIGLINAMLDIGDNVYPIDLLSRIES